MGSNTSGFQNETDLISALSNKLYAELNDNLKKFISFLFPQVNNNDKIKCYSGMVGQKPDIIIEINNKRKNVSIMHDTFWNLNIFYDPPFFDKKQAAV